MVGEEGRSIESTLVRRKAGERERAYCVGGLDGIGLRWQPPRTLTPPIHLSLSLSLAPRLAPHSLHHIVCTPLHKAQATEIGDL